MHPVHGPAPPFEESQGTLWTASGASKVEELTLRLESAATRECMYCVVLRTQVAGSRLRAGWTRRQCCTACSSNAQHPPLPTAERKNICASLRRRTRTERRAARWTQDAASLSVSRRSVMVSSQPRQHPLHKSSLHPPSSPSGGSRSSSRRRLVVPGHATAALASQTFLSARPLLLCPFQAHRRATPEGLRMR